MAKRRRYQCPDCDGIFDFLHHPDNEPPPPFCPLCGADVRTNPEKPKKRARRLKSAQVVWQPGDLLYKPTNRVVSRSADSVYRSMEEAARQRQYDAAALLGEDPRKLTGMKITNLKDNVKTGEMSYAPSSATKIQGSVVKIDGAPAGAGSFGSSGGQASVLGQAPVNFTRPGAPVPEMQAITGAVVGSHAARAAATAAAGKMK